MDQANQVIRRIDPAGSITRFAGQCITGMCAEGEEPVAVRGLEQARLPDERPDGLQQAVHAELRR